MQTALEKIALVLFLKPHGLVSDVLFMSLEFCERKANFTIFPAANHKTVLFRRRLKQRGGCALFSLNHAFDKKIGHP